MPQLMLERVSGRVIRDRAEPGAGPAMSANAPKAEAKRSSFAHVLELTRQDIPAHCEQRRTIIPFAQITS